MQIHELNNFSGTLGSGAYLAIDDGNDTGKISSQGLLAATEARIDNIIAGPAPSAEEIVDARLGDDGVTYPSLGDAIRDQFSDVKSDSINKMDGIISDAQTANLIIADAIRYGEYYDANGAIAKAGSWWRTPLIPATPSTSYSAGGCRTLFFESDGTYISDNASWSGTTFTTPANTAYIAVCSNAAYTSAYLYLTAKTPTSWVKGERLITIAKIKDFAKEVGEKGAQFFPKFTSGKNLIDVSGTYMTVIPDYYYAYNTGIKTYVAGMNYVVFPVEVGTKYVVDADNIHVAFFNSDTLSSATYVSGFLSSAGNGYTWTVPNGALYMTVSFGNSKKPTLQLEYGTTSTAYEPFEYGIRGANILNKSIDSTKLSDALVESFGLKNIVTVGSTNCDYTNICTAIKENQSNTIFKLAAETFDVEDAYEDEYGSDFFTNYTRYSQHPTDPMYRGLNLGIGCEIHGQPNTELQFLYSGNNADVAQFFSVLSLTDNNVVNGIVFNIGGKCRYAIHDDYSTITGATNIVEHCVFRGTTSDSGRPYIGTGMGKASAYIYRDCAFDGTTTRAIGLHNCEQAALGRVEIYGCYCGSDIYIFHYGTATAKTPVMIHDCKARGVYLTWADQDTYPNENMKLYAWNNEVG